MSIAVAVSIACCYRAVIERWASTKMTLTDPTFRKVRYSDSEYKKYAPNEYEKARQYNKMWFILALTLAAVILFCVFIFDVPYSLYFTLALCALAFSYKIRVWGIKSDIYSIVHSGILAEREQLTKGISTVQQDVAKFNAQIGDIKSKGNVVMAGDGAVVIIDSTISNSFNTIKKDDPILADALQTVSGAIEKSGNKDAGLAWARFLKELSGERDKSVLSALWDKVAKLVPDTATLAESAAKIASLFG